MLPQSLQDRGVSDFFKCRPQGIYYSAIIINRSLRNPGTRVSWKEQGECGEKGCERQRSSQTGAINHRPPLFLEGSFIVPGLPGGSIRDHRQALSETQEGQLGPPYNFLL